MRVLLIALLAAISYAQTVVQWEAGFSSADARTMTASVGDTLKFTWNKNSFHNVYVMPDAAAVTACDFTGATELCASRTGDDGSCETTLSTLPAYFACKVGSHCTSGQHLTVTATTTTTTTTTTTESSGGCPTACTTAIDGVACPFDAATDLSGLADCANDLVACATAASTKATDCANASTGDCEQACVDAINGVDCSTWDSQYPAECSVTTGCTTTLATKVTECTSRDCPTDCANAISAISGDACSSFNAAESSNLDGCGIGDIAPCADEAAAKTQECGNNVESNCPSTCSSAISAVNCPFTVTNLPSLEGCGGMLDAVYCATEITSKANECVNGGDSSASGLSVVFALFAFAFSQL